MNSITQKDLDRFWGKVDKEKSNTFYNGSRCWEWTGGLIRGGYALINLSGKKCLVHRVSYELNFGDIPDGLFVCHHCDNPCCVNPNHFFLGTQQDNVDDRDNKKRLYWFRGEEHPNHKLSDEQIAEIRNLYRPLARGKYSGRWLAKEYGISTSQVSNIVTYKQRKNSS
ncbi:MAG TPA: HNH endonuclease [Candidatus Binatia bacterium]|nr:HNH endonuclease [Candidatus Binatia bacterium]